MPKFEALVYNEKVRAAVANDEPHPLSDEWADQHYITQSASDEDHARHRLEEKFPPEKGFVIVDIVPLED